MDVHLQIRRADCTCFLLMKRIQRGFFTFMEKTKGTVAFSTSFAASHFRGRAHLEQQEWHCQVPFPGTALSILASRPMALNCVKMCPWVIASSVYKRFHRNAVSLDSRGNLYTVTYITESLNINLGVVPYLPLLKKSLVYIMYL